ncbi:MAG: hypothetical protein QNI84_14210 [Henriciella sp.]|nr:hypothetical protein [Henriciella sp.]
MSRANADHRIILPRLHIFAAGRVSDHLIQWIKLKAEKARQGSDPMRSVALEPMARQLTP